MIELIINPDDAHQRLDRFLLRHFNQASRNMIFKWIREKKIKVNGKKVQPNYFLQPNDVLTLFLPEDVLNSLKKDKPLPRKQRDDLDIVFENDEILILNKPVGLLTHPDKTEYKNTLATRVYFYLQHIATRSFKPAPVHRLDKNTSGLVLFCKSPDALKHYNELMRDQGIRKIYQCVVEGSIEEPGEIKGFLTKDPTLNKTRFTPQALSAESQEVHTLFRPGGIKKGLTLLEVELRTGRTHQIRACLSAIGHPIIGDTKYGGRKMPHITTQLLHAHKLILDGQAYEKESLRIREFWEAL
jgi:23S rRNA pseudouridine955/2504/2580 synthase